MILRQSSTVPTLRQLNPEAPAFELSDLGLGLRAYAKGVEGGGEAL